jgi:hypothetical protein
MTPSGQWLPKIATVHNPYPHGLGQGTKPQQHSNHSNLNNTPTNGLSFPTCLSHPRSVHLHCHTVHRLLHLPFLGLQQQAGSGSLRAPWLPEFQLPSEISNQHLLELLFVINILTLINIISSASPTCSYHEKT